MSDEDLEGWPNAGDRLIAPGDVRSSGAYLGSFHRRFNFFASAFKLAGDKLVEAALAERPSNRDRLAWPILASYRHSIELLLKDVIATAQGEGSIAKTKHELDELLGDLKNLIGNLYGHTDPIGLAEVESLVLEFHQADSRAQAFRYPVDKAGNEFASVPNNVDLSELRSSIDKVVLFLECLSADIRHRCEQSVELTWDESFDYKAERDRGPASGFEPNRPRGHSGP